MLPHEFRNAGVVHLPETVELKDMIIRLIFHSAKLELLLKAGNVIVKAVDLKVQLC